MDTKKAIAEAAREMLRIANEAGRSLKDFKNSSLHYNYEIRRESEALRMAGLADGGLERVCMDCFWAIKSYVPETRLESHIAPNGYVMRSMVKAPQIVEIEAFQAACYLLIQKYTYEAGWAHKGRVVPGTFQMELVKLTCSSCGKPSYTRSAGDLKYGETLCASCLSLHLAKSH